MSWPLEGILFDIEWNEFWAPSWGQRPDDLSEAKRIATEQVNAAPTLVPVVGHRYIPSEPCIAGNPVLSVYQTDIIVYADNLQNVLRFDYHPGVGERSQFAPGFQLSTHARDS